MNEAPRCEMCNDLKKDLGVHIFEAWVLRVAKHIEARPAANTSSLQS